MFTHPIRYTKLNGIEEVKDFSIAVPCNGGNFSKVWNGNSGVVLFIDENGHWYKTAIRPEIPDILTNAGYRKDDTLCVPKFEGKEIPEEWQWIVQIASEEWRNYTYEEAYKIASEKGIKPDPFEHYFFSVTEISYNRDRYRPMVTKALSNFSTDNIGTYIIVDEKTVYVCDEYGKSYVLSVSADRFNDLVNALLEAGYTRNTRPSLYVCS